jgi:hypothetical protein
VRHFAEDPAQAPAIDDVVKQLHAIRAGAHLDSDRYLELIATFVQSIPYDTKSLKAGRLEMRFPVETLVDRRGLCGAKSVLLAALLKHEGYSVAVLEFGPENHMAVGVRGTSGDRGRLGDRRSGRVYPGTGWLFLETTSPTYVSDVPERYSGGVRLKSKPLVHVLRSAGTAYHSAGDVRRIVSVRESAVPAATALLAAAKKRSLTAEEAYAINRKLRIAAKASNSLRSNVVDKRGKRLGSLMDRAAAIAWIERNVWWR